MVECGLELSDAWLGGAGREHGSPAKKRCGTGMLAVTDGTGRGSLEE